MRSNAVAVLGFALLFGLLGLTRTPVAEARTCASQLPEVMTLELVELRKDGVEEDAVPEWADVRHASAGIKAVFVHGPGGFAKGFGRAERFPMTPVQQGYTAELDLHARRVTACGTTAWPIAIEPGRYIYMSEHGRRGPARSIIDIELLVAPDRQTLVLRVNHDGSRYDITYRVVCARVHASDPCGPTEPAMPLLDHLDELIAVKPTIEPDFPPSATPGPRGCRVESNQGLLACLLPLVILLARQRRAGR